MILAKTDIGKTREINQDCYYIPTENDELQLFIIADGMGGYSGGEVASNIAVLTAKKHIENELNGTKRISQGRVREILTKAFEIANEQIYEESRKNKELEEMGTTLDICLIYNNNMYIAHVGDSRVYVIKKEAETITQLTEDDSYVQTLINQGTITKEEAKTHPDKNKLMKALGGPTTVNATVICRKTNLEEIYLMCTDGLTNMISDEKILEIIINNKYIAEHKLIEEANNNGGKDNVTVVLVNTENTGNEV